MSIAVPGWGASATRPPRDIDLLGYLPNQVESLVEIIREVGRQEVEPDDHPANNHREITDIRIGGQRRGSTD